MVSAATIPIGIYGSDGAADPRGRGCGLWPTGYAGAVSAAGGVPLLLRQKPSGQSWDNILDGVGGIGSGDRSCERIDDRLRSTSDEVRRACPSFRPAKGRERRQRVPSGNERRQRRDRPCHDHGSVPSENPSAAVGAKDRPEPQREHGCHDHLDQTGRG